jgi:cytochrome P450
VGAVAEWTERLVDRGAFALAGELAGLMTRVVCANLLRGADAERMAVPAGAALRAMGTRARIGVPLPDRLPLPPVSTMRHAVARLNRSYDATRRPSGAQPDLRRNLADLRDDHGWPLLDDAAVRAEVNVMVAVGGHQLALALGWALHLLDGHPAALGALQEELDRVLGGRSPGLEDLPALAFTGQVVDETLRLYPPFYLIGRQALCDTCVAGWRIPRATTVVLSPWVTQRLGEHFQRPAEFLPQRWTPQLRRELPRAAYFPFGGGPRLCVAQAAARGQLTLVLAAVAARHRVRLDPRCAVRPRATASLEMRPGVMARLESRR